MASRISLLVVAALASIVSAALTVNLDDQASIKAAAQLVSKDMLTFYRGDEPGWVPGILPGPPPDGDYYWWQGGAMWGTLMDYRYYTGDKTFDDTITKALLFQVGPRWDYSPPNWTASLGNDDQAFWGFAAMTAAETGYTDPPKDQPQWLALVQAVFNEQSSLDRRAPSGTGKCEWGLRWQVFQSNNGYNYVNTISNACYLNMGARLAKYTGNQTYADLATKTWDWLMDVGYIDSEYSVFDGANLPKSCTDVNRVQFSYNAAVLIHGLSFLFNQTTGATQQKWQTHLTGLVNRTLELFFVNGTAYEPACESAKCNMDMVSFKGFMHRWLSQAAQQAPFLAPIVMPVLKESARQAVAQCTGGTNGRMCGFHWSSGVFDGTTSAAAQQNVVAALSSLLVPISQAPKTNSTGGTSVGNPGAGAPNIFEAAWAPVTAADRVGGGIITGVLVLCGAASFIWMAWD